jgi:hypothetical protein
MGRVNPATLKEIFWMEKVLSFELTTNLLEDFR